MEGGGTSFVGGRIDGRGNSSKCGEGRCPFTGN